MRTPNDVYKAPGVQVIQRANQTWGDWFAEKGSNFFKQGTQFTRSRGLTTGGNHEYTRQIEIDAPPEKVIKIIEEDGSYTAPMQKKPFVNGGRERLLGGNQITTKHYGNTFINETIDGEHVLEGTVVRTVESNGRGGSVVKTIGRGKSETSPLPQTNVLLGQIMFAEIDRKLKNKAEDQF